MPLRTAVRRLPEDAVFLPADQRGVRRGERAGHGDAALAVATRVDAGARCSAGTRRSSARRHRPEPGTPSRWPTRLQRAVLERTALHCSVGIGDNKLQARPPRGSASRGGSGGSRATQWLEVMGERPVDRAVGDRDARPPAGSTSWGSAPSRSSPRRTRRCWRSGSARRWGRGTAGWAAASTAPRSTRRLGAEGARPGDDVPAGPRGLGRRSPARCARSRHGSRRTWPRRGDRRRGSGSRCATRRSRPGSGASPCPSPPGTPRCSPTPPRSWSAGSTTAGACGWSGCAPR